MEVMNIEQINQLSVQIKYNKISKIAHIFFIILNLSAIVILIAHLFVDWIEYDVSDSNKTVSIQWTGGLYEVTNSESTDVKEDKYTDLKEEYCDLQNYLNQLGLKNRQIQSLCTTFTRMQGAMWTYLTFSVLNGILILISTSLTVLIAIFQYNILQHILAIKIVQVVTQTLAFLYILGFSNCWFMAFDDCDSSQPYCNDQPRKTDAATGPALSITLWVVQIIELTLFSIYFCMAQPQIQIAEEQQCDNYQDEEEQKDACED